MKAKADGEVGMGRVIERVEIAGNAATLTRLAPGLPDVVAAVRCRAHELVEDAALEDGVFAARNPVFAPKEG